MKNSLNLTTNITAMLTKTTKPTAATKNHPAISKVALSIEISIKTGNIKAIRSVTPSFKMLR